MAANGQKWKMKRRSDVELFDSIFRTDVIPGQRQDALNWATCPVCFQFAERVVGCNYMNHNCSAGGHYYNVELYNKYKNPEGFVFWCTVCGRICIGHSHYKLSSPEAPKPAVLPGGHPFDVECFADGGGGLLEKMKRFRRGREVIKALEAEDSIMTQDQAMTILIKEMWRAPLLLIPTDKTIRAMMEFQMIDPGSGKITKGKFTNIPTNVFPPNIRPVNANIQKILAPLPVEKLPFLKKLTEPVDDVVTYDEIYTVIRFKHSDKHTDATDEIGIKGLFEHLRLTFENIGRCWYYPTCNAMIHPDEVDFILQQPETVEEVDAAEYEEMVKIAKKYRERFTNVHGMMPPVTGGGGAAAGGAGGAGAQRKGRRGTQKGGVRGMNIHALIPFTHANDATCVLPPRATNRRTRKRRANRKKN